MTNSHKGGHHQINFGAISMFIKWVLETNLKHSYSNWILSIGIEFHDESQEQQYKIKETSIFMLNVLVKWKIQLVRFFCYHEQISPFIVHSFLAGYFTFLTILKIQYTEPQTYVIVPQPSSWLRWCVISKFPKGFFNDFERVMDLFSRSESQVELFTL